MKKLIIVKMDTPCTLKESAQRVPQAEPVNFAKAIIAANPNETVDVVMLGLTVDQMEYGNNGTIRIVPYYGNPTTMKSEIDEDTKIIFWQGRHSISCQMPTSPYESGANFALLEPYNAPDYERLNLIKMWTVMMYNFMSSAVVLNECQKFFILTDARIPLLELNKIDPIAVPKPLPKNIILVTQTYHADSYMQWQNKYGNAYWYPEADIADYMYQFKKAVYLPLHSLPLISHSKFNKPLSQKTGVSIFQVQSLKYIDEYRRKKLGTALKYVDGNCTLHGKFGAPEKGIVVSYYSEFADKLLARCIDNSNTTECFHDSAKILSNYQASLIITDARYARFGLCPNRFVEAVAVGTIPLITPDVMVNCDPVLKDCIKILDICPEKTKIQKTTFEIQGDKYKVVVYDNEGRVIEYVEPRIEEVTEILSKQLIESLADFSDMYYEV